MSDIRIVSKMNQEDQQLIRRGYCSVCFGRLADGSLYGKDNIDICMTCNQHFTWKLTMQMILEAKAVAEGE